jgi:hypothetical protein
MTAPRTERSASRLLGSGFSRVKSEGINCLVFAFISPTVTQTPFAAQYRFARDALLTEISQVAKITLGSTYSLFAPV